MLTLLLIICILALPSVSLGFRPSKWGRNPNETLGSANIQIIISRVNVADLGTCVFMDLDDGLG